jgi:hypothetical protein
MSEQSELLVNAKELLSYLAGISPVHPAHHRLMIAVQNAENKTAPMYKRIRITISFSDGNEMVSDIHEDGAFFFNALPALEEGAHVTAIAVGRPEAGVHGVARGEPVSLNGGVIRQEESDG